MKWQLQDAKNKLSQLVKDARHEPQTILVRGREEAVLVSSKHYEELTRQGSLLSFLQNSPWSEVELDLERSQDSGRSVEL